MRTPQWIAIAIASAALACRPSAAPSSAVVPDAGADAAPSATADAHDAGADAQAARAEEAERDAGPFEEKLGARTVWFAVPPRKGPRRLVAMLHGVCNPPGYACGHWWRAAVEKGFLVCPEGNGRCSWSCEDCRADRKEGPPSWEESFADVDKDLERAVAKVSDGYPGEIDRDGAVLAGFSRGAYAAVTIARMHPGRWPYLVLNEADTEVTAAQLRAAGVRAVVLMAGGAGLNLGPERKTLADLQRDGFRAKLVVMPKAGHHYSDDIEELMRQALAWFDEADAG